MTLLTSKSINRSVDVLRMEAGAAVAPASTLVVVVYNDKCKQGRSDFAPASTLVVVVYNDKCEQGRCDLAHKVRQQ